MDTTELVFLIGTLIVIVVVVLLTCYRCCGSMATMAGEAAEAKPSYSFPGYLGGQLRRSFRRATAFWGDQTETVPPIPISSVSGEIIHASDLHPVYFHASPAQATDSPPRYEDVTRKPPDTSRQRKSQWTSQTEPMGDCHVVGVDNPAYDLVDTGDVVTFDRTYIQHTNSGVIFPDSETQCIQSESYI